MFFAQGFTPLVKQCIIARPLDTAPLVTMKQLLECHIQYNFFPSVLTLGAGVLTLHYGEFLNQLKYCPIPLLFSSSSGTGKLYHVML